MPVVAHAELGGAAEGEAILTDKLRSPVSLAGGWPPAYYPSMRLRGAQLSGS